MTSSTVYIAVDAMGGDFGPRITVPAACLALQHSADIAITLFGSESEIRRALPSQEKLPDRLSICHCAQSVGMDNRPSQILKTGKKSALYAAVESLSQNPARYKAVVSAGNTGAFMAVGKHLLGMFQGVERPAICASLPSLKERTWLLDLGANIGSSAERLFQYAQMGTVLVRTLEGVEAPKVALLNIGSEQFKGNDQLRLAADMMEQSGEINYAGFVEGNDIFTGTTDVIVCDGFVGNTLIKANQGLARLISDELASSARQTEPESGKVIIDFVDAFRTQIDPGRYNGASFLGLKATAVVSHGSANIEAFIHAIELAVRESQLDLPMRLSSHFNQ